MSILRYNQMSEQPWKNGLGRSRLIAAGPPGVVGFGEDLLWQVSIPEIVTSGPFSPLAGLDRQWMLLEGAGAELHCVDAKHEVDFRHSVEQPLEALAFQGDWQTECRLVRGAVKALSVLARRGRAGARLRIVPLVGTQAIEKASDERIVILVASGQVRVHTAGAMVNPPLARLDALVGDGPQPESYSVSPAGWNAATVVVATISLL